MDNKLTLVQASIVAVVAAIVVGLVVLTFMPKAVTRIEQVAGTSPSGTNLNTAKYAGAAGINLASPGSGATSTSILNADANDRYITSLAGGCEGVGTSLSANAGSGLAAFTVTAGTTSSAGAAVKPTGFNPVGGNAITIATSTPNDVFASSTVGVGAAGISTTSAVWAAGSYLTFFTNATNTAVCTFGAHYIQS